jgi:hypothetical protein
MSVFKLPLTLCDELMKQVRAFWWGTENGRRKVQWIPWEKLLMPKGFGGMGFKDLRLMNQAMLARQAWRLVASPDSLCAKVLKAKYYPPGNLLDRAPAGEASQIWRAIEYELLKQGVIHRIGDGRSTQNCRDNWLPREYGLKPIGPSRMCRLRWVHHLIDDNGDWEETAVHRFFYPCDAAEIFSIKLPEQRTADFVAWHYEKTGIFSMRSAYRLAVQNQYRVGAPGSSASSDQGRAGWKKLWQVRVPSKVSVFAMKAANNGLPTRVNKKYRHLDQQDVCELCGSHEEVVFHALLVCPHAVALRQAMRNHWHLPAEEDLVRTGPDWLLMLVLNNSLEVLANLFMLLWHIWSIRNKVVHEGASPFIASSVTFLIRYMRSLLEIRQHEDHVDLKGKRTLEPAARIEVQNSDAQGTLRRKRPPHGTLKINVDAAFNHSSRNAAVGVAIRDWGLPKTNFAAYHILCRDAEEAEAKACLEGV